MKKIVVYECEHCKKLFKTPDRHKCKKDPELKNCWTCKHYKGWIEAYREDDGSPEGCIVPPSVECDKKQEYDLEEIKSMSYDMQCAFWEKGDYWKEHDFHEEEVF